MLTNPWILDRVPAERKHNSGNGGAKGSECKGTSQQIGETRREKMVADQERLKSVQVDAAIAPRKQQEKPVQRIEGAGLKLTQVGLARIDIRIPKQQSFPS